MIRRPPRSTLFPSRRSSDLLIERALGKGDAEAIADDVEDLVDLLGIETEIGLDAEQRSEEHTSELQSHSELVCRLLLVKKKQQCAMPDTSSSSTYAESDSLS